METSERSSAATDMISSLPDSLLLDIMSQSILTTRDAVRTSLLSERWRNLWVSLHYLHFDLSQFSKDEHDKFCNFVDAVLNHRETYLHAFRLSCVQFEEARYNASVGRWIFYAIDHAVRVLRLETNVDAVLPNAIFNCKSLEELSLCIHKSKLALLQVMKLTNGAIYVPRLKKLHLKGRGIFLDSVNFKEFLSECPALEELWLDNIYLNYRTTISSASLKRLTIYKCHCGYLDLVDAPNLVHFDFSGKASILAPYSHVLCTPSLIEAKIVLYRTWGDIDVYLGRILNELSMVEKLHLCILVGSSSVDSIGSFRPHLHNLKSLSICGLFAKDSIFFLSSLWKYLPNLQKLTLWEYCPNCACICEAIEEWDVEWYAKLEVWRKEILKFEKLVMVEIKISSLSGEVKRRVDALLHCMMDLQNFQVTLSEL